MSNVYHKDSSTKIQLFVIGAILLAATCAAAYDDKNPRQCTVSSKVVDILSLEYRDATIKLENGQVVRVNQATLKKGDDYCLKYERKNNSSVK